jgi:hypothetical protein
MRTIWLSIMMIAGILIAATSGILSWIDGMSPAGAIIIGASAFGGSLILMMAIKRFLDDDGPRVPLLEARHSYTLRVPSATAQHV